MDVREGCWLVMAVLGRSACDKLCERSKILVVQVETVSFRQTRILFMLRECKRRHCHFFDRLRCMYQRAHAKRIWGQSYIRSGDGYGCSRRILIVFSIESLSL
jgi:hypothetical protein